MTPRELWRIAATLNAAVDVIESFEERADFLTQLKLRTLLTELDDVVEIVELETYYAEHVGDDETHVVQSAA